MIEQLFTSLSEMLSGSPGIALFSSFAWGIMSILLSPCHLSSIPLVIGFLSSQGNISGKRTVGLSSVFGLGIMLTIALIGIITAMAGRMIGSIGVTGNYLVAGVFFVVGLYLMDIIKLSWGKGLQGTKFKGYTAALVLGLLFGIGLGPCTFAYMAPVLGVVFTSAQTNVLFAIALLLAFAIGHCGVIVLAGSMTNVVGKYLNWTEESKAVSYMKKICGALVIIAGIYMIYKV